MGLDADVVRPTRDSAANSYGSFGIEGGPTTIAAQMEKKTTATKKAAEAKKSDPNYLSSHDGHYMVNHYEGEGDFTDDGEPHV